MEYIEYRPNMNNTKDRNQLLANTEIFYKSVVCIMYNPFLVHIVLIFIFNGTPINSDFNAFFLSKSTLTP